jgi:putative ABC transport system permease protein
MLQNYFKIALRNLLRHKGTSAVNVFGLAVGMAACLLLSLYVQDEFSYDGYHKNKASLYHLYTLLQNAEGEERINSHPMPLTSALVAEVPEVERAARYAGDSKTSIRVGNNVFRDAPSYTDPDFFKMFSFAFLQGSPDAALTGMNNIVLEKKMADKLFGTGAPAIGKTVQMMVDGVYKDFVVGGVIADVPSTSTFELGVVVRFEQQRNYQKAKDEWNSWNHDVFVQLRSGVDAASLEPKLTKFAEQHYTEDISDRKKAGVKPSPRGKYVEPRLQPLEDMHFNTMIEPNSFAKNFVIALGGIGVFIVLIACINFINLSIARSVGRTKEVGVRKSLGAGKRDIIVQFLGEALLVVVVATVLSLVLAEVFLPVFNAAMGKKLAFHLAENWMFIGGILAGLVVVGVLAGAYPALYVSRFEAATALKDAVRGKSPRRVRSALVIVQFSIAVALIASTLVVRQQTNFLHSKSLGFDREQVVMIPVGDAATGQATLRRYKSMLASRTDVIGMSGSAMPIGRGLDGSNFRSNSNSTFRGGILKMSLLRVDFNYPETMKIPLVAGRTLSEQFISADTTQSLVVNESFARQVWSLLPTAEQKTLSNGTGEYSAQALINLPLVQAPDTTKMLTIAGVVKDFHFESLRSPIRPAVMFAIPIDQIRYIFVRIRPGNMDETMNALKTAWQQVSPDVPWQGSFLDENIERQYRSQTRQTTLTMTGAGLAIVLSCIGLFALSAMMLLARTKEIGIRKVLGASATSIIALVSKDFLKLVAIAIVIGTPLAYWFSNKWLADYAYKIDLSVWMFAAAGAMAVGIAFITVAAQAWRAAQANPVNALRSE